MEWMIMPLKRYADFNGRSRRTEFWMFQLLNVLVYGAVIVLMLSGVPWSALNQAESGLPADPGAMFWVGMVVLVFWALVTVVPNLAVTIRRLHDRNMSGWWYLGFVLVNFVPFVNLLASIAFLVLMCLPGTPGDNNFGGDPKDSDNLDVFA